MEEQQAAPASPVPALPTVDLPRDQVHAGITDGFIEVLGLDDTPDPQVSFFDLGGDSFQAVRLAARLSRLFDVDVPALAIVDHPTTLQLTAALSGSGPIVSGPVVSMHPEATGTPWFLLCERSNPETLLPLAAALGPDHPVHVLLPETMWRGSATQRTLAETAADQVPEVLRLAPSRPVALFGNCSEGTMAYELARQLREQGHDVAIVAVTDAPRPAADPWLERRGFRWLRQLHEPYGTFHRRRGVVTTLARQAAKMAAKPSTTRMVLGGYRHQARALRLLDRQGPIPDGRELAYARYLYAYRFRIYDPPPAPQLPLVLLTSDDHGEELRAAWAEVTAEVTRAAVDTSHAALLALQEPVRTRLAAALRVVLDQALTHDDR